jgi:hypothetical protein
LPETKSKIIQLYEVVAALHKMPVDKLIEITHQNASRLFSLSKEGKSLKTVEKAKSVIFQTKRPTAESFGWVEPMDDCLTLITDPAHKLIIFGDSYENLHAVKFLTDIN